jgi:hypothetical protein
MKGAQKYWILLVLSLLLLIGSTAALDQDDISVTPNKEWVIAGSSDTVELTVGINIDVGYTVRIWCMDPAMGSITEGAEEQVASNGTATATFTVGTKSGDARIMVNVTTDHDGSNETIYYQKVDHAIPKYYTINYDPIVTVGQDALISVRLKDMYGNFIDTRRPQKDYDETVTLLASPDGNGGFSDNTTYVYKIIRPVNWTANVTYRVPTRGGNNVIQVKAPSSVVNNIQWITIIGTPDDPSHIASAITSTIDTDISSPHNATANGKDVFFLYYTMYDQYDNPVPEVNVTWQIYSLDRLIDTRSYITNYQGQIYLEHGPSTVIQNFTVTAKKTGNSSISCTDTLSYIPGGPSLFVLYANPEIMASREIDQNSTAAIRARLMDGLGRPLQGKAVHFTITSDTGSGSPLIQNASFDPIEKIWYHDTTTDASGYAQVTFYPGKFPRFNENGWSPDSSGMTEVTATCEDLGGRNLVLSYKNYPYLRAETELAPSLVAVNDTVDISIRLIGDGFVQYKPIDVMLCNNRGEAMLKDMYWEGDRGRVEDKMVYLYEATRNFIFNLEGGANYIGLVSFGINGSVNIPHDANSNYGLPGVDNNASDDLPYTDAHYSHPKNYSDYATVDSDLTNNLDAVVSILNETSPSKDPQGTVLVPMRYGLYQSINTLNTSGHAGHVRGIILLTDSEWTAYGDPTAGWDDSKGTAASQGYYTTERDPVTLSQGGKGLWTAFTPWAKTDVRQDMAHYANENNVHIYTIAYFKKGTIVPVSLDTILQYLAGSTGGKYYVADSAKALDEIYVDIAEDLKKYASVDTAMNLSFEQINVTYDNITESFPGGDVFSYQYEQYVSTNVTSWNKTINPLPDNLPVPPYPADAIPAPHKDKGVRVINYPYSLNQTAQWSSGTLNFYAGSIVMGQTWQVKFRLQALTPGFIDLFGPNSAICYTNEDKPVNCIPMPGTYLTVTSNRTGDPTSQNDIDILDGSINATPNGKNDWTTISWMLNYTGPSTVIQDVFYQFSTDGSFWSNNWISFGVVRTEAGPLDCQVYSTPLDMREITGCIKIRIFAREEVTPAGASDEEISGIICPIRGPSIKIT